MAREEDYSKNRNGDLEYLSFKPWPLSSKLTMEFDHELINLLSEASFHLGVLHGKSSLLPNLSLYQEMAITKEALLSSQIEGTQTSLDDVLDQAIDANVDLDKQELINYINAINFANELSTTLPLSLRYIRKVHAVLLKGARGKEKNPGEFRTSQNRLGSTNSTLKIATFIPPNVQDIEQALFDLEKFIHENDTLPPLIKIGLIHYQFETIHPFLDGNGRIGRLLIHLLFKEYNLLPHDTIFVSYYLKKNKREYYDRLNDVRRKGHYEEWLKFFIQTVIHSAIHSNSSIDALELLNKNDTSLINSLDGTIKSTCLALFNYIQKNPIFSIKHAAKSIEKSYNTTAKAIAELRKLSIVKPRNNQERNRSFVYEQYLDILKN